MFLVPLNKSCITFHRPQHELVISTLGLCGSELTLDMVMKAVVAREGSNLCNLSYMTCT
jgi:hypothetical protein